MAVKKIIAGMTPIFLFLLWWSTAEALEKDQAWVRKETFEKAMEYARSISCSTGSNQDNLVALVPWTNLEDQIEREKAKYALIWFGDIGCGGGTGSVNPYITIVRIGAGDSFIVDLSASSPLIKFEAPVRINKIIRATADELILSGLECAPTDPHSHPTIPVLIRLKDDGIGNWRLVEKTQLE